MTETAKKKKRFWRRRRYQIPCALIVVLILVRNPLLRISIELIGSRVLGCSVKVEQVKLGFGRLELSHLTVSEAAAETRQLLGIKHIEARLASTRQILDGIYLRNVNVESPELQLRFDADGNLLSQLPQSPESDEPQTELSIPLEFARVTHAKLVIIQDGKAPFSIELDELELKNDQELTLRGVANNVLGGSARFESSLDAQTLQGETTLDVDGVGLDTIKLSKLPFVPASVAEEQVTGTGSISIKLRHPPNEFDPRKHEAHVEAQLDDLQAAISDQVPITARATIHCEQGQVAARFETEPLDGLAIAEIQCDLMSWPLKIELNAGIENVDLKQLDGHLAEFIEAPPSYAAETGLTAKLTAIVDSESIIFSGQVHSLVNKMHIEEIRLGDVKTSVEVDGRLNFADLGLAGDIKGNLDWQGVSLESVYAKLLPPTSLTSAKNETTTGTIRASANFAIPLAKLIDPSSYQIESDVVLHNLGAQGMTLSNATIHSTLQNGVARVEFPSTSLANQAKQSLGNISANITGGVTPESIWTASFEANGISSPSIVRLLGQDERGFAGQIDTRAEASVTLQDVIDPTRWSANVELHARGLVLQHEALSDFDAACFIQDGHISIPQVNTKWRNTTFAFLLEGTIDKSLKIGGEFATSPIYLNDISSALSRYSSTPVPLQGSADVRGNFQLAAMPLSFSANGNSRLVDASYAGKRIGEANVTWAANQDGILIEHTSKDFIGGTSKTVASVQSLDWTKTKIAGEFRNVPAARVTSFADVDVPATGVIDGTFEVSEIESLNSLKGKATLQSRGITVRGVKFGLNNCDLAIGNGKADVSGRGQLSTGSFDFTAATDLQQLVGFIGNAERNLQDAPLTGELKVSKAPIRRLITAAGFEKELSELDGNVSLTCARDAESQQSGLIGQATFTTENVSWDRARLSEYLTGDIDLGPERVTLRRLQGRVADGQVNGNAEVTIVGKPRGTFRFSVTSVNLRRATAPFLDSQLITSGQGSVSLSGRIDNAIYARVSAEASNITAAGVSIRRVRIPMDLSYSLDSQVARWNCRAGVVEVGQGRVHLNSEGTYYRSITMNNTVRIEHVDSSKLIVGKSFGVGIIDGICTLQARKTNVPEKMTGTFDITLSQTKAMEMPVLDKLPQMIQLPTVSLTPTQENGGYLYGRFGGGLVHLEEMAITQSNVQVLASGKATLDGGLDLDVTASTSSDGPIDELLSLADSPVMAAGAAPVALVARANDALKNRVVHVQVAGTAENPNIRLNPGKQLSQDAIQFFLRSTLGSRVANTAAAQQQRRRK